MRFWQIKAYIATTEHGMELSFPVPPFYLPAETPDHTPIGWDEIVPYVEQIINPVRTGMVVRPSGVLMELRSFLTPVAEVP